jgi:chemotaxis protein methyltransferase CheR
MHISDIDFFRDFLYRQTGLQIAPDKSFLLDSRLTPVAKKWHFPTMRAMTLALRGIPDPRIIADVIEAMVEAETSFFHDEAFFRDLKDRIVPWLVHSRQGKSLSIWSAACASGQETLSIAMVLREFEERHKLRGWRFSVLGSDLSHTAIERAKAGRYTQIEVQHGLPAALLTKYFMEAEGRWQVAREIAGIVRYELFNLVADEGEPGPFDLVVCRNVLSGFDEPTKQKVLARMVTALGEKSLLALSDADLPGTLPEGLQPVENCAGLYAGPTGPGRLDLQTRFNKL